MSVLPITHCAVCGSASIAQHKAAKLLDSKQPLQTFRCDKGHVFIVGILENQADAKGV
jgi:hypothetical protein